jgi:hypothetical protein
MAGKRLPDHFSRHFVGCAIVVVSMLKQVLGLLLISASISFAETPPVPVQAELLHPIEAGHIKVGDPVLAKVEVEWKGAQCHLRKGATLKGRVVLENERTRTARASKLALIFESGECNGKDMKPIPLTVAAMIAPSPQDTNLFNEEQMPALSDAVGLGLNGDSIAVSGNGMRSVTQAAQTVIFQPTQRKPPKAVMPGQVLGMRNVKLNVGTGPEGSSIISDDHHNLRLESGLQFVLVPNVKARAASPAAKIVPTTVTTSASNVARTVPSVPEFVDTTEVCEPPQCSIAAATDTSLASPGSVSAISIKNLAYVSSSNRDMYHFDREAALSYLGENQLLFTFDPHELVPRIGLSGPWRTIRSVLIDVKTEKIKRVEDWLVPDGGQYLWPIGSNKVLVHIGRQLRVYGPGLRLEQSVVVNGPLAFVAISPSSKYFAVGVVQERHTAAIHRQLEEAEGREPEEDVEVRVLDAEFRTLARVVRSSFDAPPVLSDEGEIRIPTIGKNRWRVVEQTWAGQRRVLAEVRSTCRVSAKSLPPDLLFITGCDQPSGTWYRMLTSEGKPVLKGHSSSEELGQLAEGRAASGLFAVAVTKASKSIAPEVAFRSNDLESEHIVLYRANNGQKVLAVNVASPIPTFQSFGISPSGDQLAVFKSGEIAFYSVPATGETAKQ